MHEFGGQTDVWSLNDIECLLFNARLNRSVRYCVCVCAFVRQMKVNHPIRMVFLCVNHCAHSVFMVTYALSRLYSNGQFHFHNLIYHRYFSR